MGDDQSNVSYHPSEGLCYDPSDPKYWDPALLDLELRRAFEICHGCRLCFKYCDAFPRLFRILDQEGQGGVRKLTAAQVHAVMEDCFQCKLCEVQCPYTPRDQHPFQLDFPKLVHRYQAIRHRASGFSFRERLLGDPDRAGGAARLSLGMANLMNGVKPHRWLMEKLAGIHRDKRLPDFASESFDAWAQRHGKVLSGPGAEVVVFQTCFVQHNDPGIGRDLLEVLDRNGVRAGCVKGLRCCGMPAWEHGDLEGLRRNAALDLDLLLPHVQAGAKVLVINPTCAMMMRKEWPELLLGPDRERARQLAGAVMDPGEYLWSIRKEPRFCSDFRSSPGPIAYHAPCHLRVQAIGFKGRDLLRRIPGVTVQTVMACCGHNGTFALKTEGFAPSARLGSKAFEAMQATGAAVWASECPLAAIQFQQHAGKKPLHPVSILARAYLADGFPTHVPGDPA